MITSRPAENRTAPISLDALLAKPRHFGWYSDGPELAPKRAANIHWAKQKAKKPAASPESLAQALGPVGRGIQFIIVMQRI
jgi:hypothetical protein